MARRRTAAISGDPAGEQAGPGLSIRLDPAPGLRIGPGKVRLLEEIGRNGSISAAGRALGMSYRRAWELVEDLNRGLGRPVVETAAGGAGGGGARLTRLGERVIREYRSIEAEAHAAALPRLLALLRPEEDGEPGGA
ncbi:Molybdenum-pterin binding protein mopB [Roseomonas mucosa]|uniref:Transcriptional regulator modE n=3 Tax=Roseomonas mucosa TaxID=207340 RepID=A0A379N173_9PROT|nr:MULTISPECIES: LysR family transcriptional regulator [Roseomonas]MBS5903113.1 LysR family transcriptional regulator [Acetobacteraceae bacterium]AWV21445.1 Molybdenum-pterin binding protein mopB [Roseomonas mucosa]MCG7353619.1 LysR family transcriptional regulator [Roseomonas mucosa]MDT8289055.1 LysR family transcriptional regulator [Roseomonas mucosa]MDT8294016.1 LysR family transcriptional regulator [Roseomonas mucosa]